MGFICVYITVLTPVFVEDETICTISTIRYSTGIACSAGTAGSAFDKWQSIGALLYSRSGQSTPIPYRKDCGILVAMMQNHIHTITHVVA